MDAVGQAELIRSGEVSATEMVDAAIGRIEAVNPQLNAVVRDRFDRARTEAAGGLPDGPFRGVPLLLKDLSAEVEGETLYEGMRFLRDAYVMVQAGDTIEDIEETLFAGWTRDELNKVRS